jgi:hypothetical protein
MGHMFAGGIPPLPACVDALLPACAFALVPACAFALVPAWGLVLLLPAWGLVLLLGCWPALLPAGGLALLPAGGLALLPAGGLALLLACGLALLLACGLALLLACGFPLGLVCELAPLSAAVASALGVLCTGATFAGCGSSACVDSPPHATITQLTTMTNKAGLLLITTHSDTRDPSMKDHRARVRAGGVALFRPNAATVPQTAFMHLPPRVRRAAMW